MSLAARPLSPADPQPSATRFSRPSDTLLPFRGGSLCILAAAQAAPHRRPCIMVNETSEPEAASHRCLLPLPTDSLLSSFVYSPASCPADVPLFLLAPVATSPSPPMSSTLRRSYISRCSSYRPTKIRPLRGDLIILMNSRNLSNDLEGRVKALGSKIFLSHRRSNFSRAARSGD